MYMKLLISISSLMVFFIYASAFSQQVQMNDLSYVISEEDEQIIKQSSVADSKYIIEVLTPRRYVNGNELYTTNSFSDILLYYHPTQQSYSFDIFIVNDDFESEEFEEFISHVKAKTKNDFFVNNQRTEGLKYAVDEIIKKLNVCPFEISIDQNDEFTPNIDNDNLDILINSACEEFKFVKLEVRSIESDIPVYSIIKEKSSLSNNKIVWNGEVSGKEYRFIRSLDSPIAIKVILGKDESFSSYVTANVQVEIPSSVDEWNKHKFFFDGYVVKNDYPGSNYEFYVNVLKELMIQTIPPEHLQNDKSPLDYMSENLVSIKFLDRDFQTHKKFAEKLISVENRLKSRGEFTDIANEYSSKINGSFALRKIANSTSMSPHSMAAAIDIDPDHNPHIKLESGRQIFEVIKYITNVNMYGNKPSEEDMKSANELFKATFNGNFLKKIADQSKITSESIVLANNKVKSDGEFDMMLSNFYNELSETFALYMDVEPSVTEEERRQEAFYLDKMRALKTQINLLSESIKSFFSNEPSYDLMPPLNTKIMKDKEMLFKKVDALLFYNTSTNYISLKNEHARNTVQDIGSLVETSKITKISEINQYVQNQKSSLLAFASNGFFEMDLRLVKAFLTEPKTRWGGNYNHEKDFMHFELYELTPNLK